MAYEQQRATPRTSRDRLRRIAERIVALDPLGPDIANQVRRLQDEARIALDEKVLAPGNDMRFARAASSQRRHDDYMARVRALKPLIKAIRAEGKVSYRQIAEALTERGIAPPRGGGGWPISTLRKIDLEEI